MTRGRIAAGRSAERLAAELLERAGVRVLRRNLRLRRAELGVAGELDLVCLDGRALVFVEVKAARPGAARGPERPALAVTPRKQAQVRRLARAWLASRPALPPFATIRFDVVGVTLGPEGRAAGVEWLRGAF